MLDIACRARSRIGLGVALVIASAAAGADAALCQRGLRQSPIDIVATVRQPLAPLEFDYRSAPLKIANDGHTARVRLANSSRLKIGRESYVLQQFHFHTPGGDRLAGEEFPMAAHLLHKGKSGQLLALVVLFRPGAENPAVKALLPHIPAHADGDHLIAGVVVEPNALLPARKGYYRYDGSLTDSPCTEGVTWLVMRQPLELSPEQLALWRVRFADNMRPPQPLNGRVVLESR